MNIDAKFEIGLITIDATFEKESGKGDEPFNELVFPISNSIVTDIQIGEAKSRVDRISELVVKKPKGKTDNLQPSLFHQLRINLRKVDLVKLKELEIKVKLISRLSISHTYAVNNIVDNAGDVEANQPVFELRVFRVYDQDLNVTGFNEVASTRTGFSLRSLKADDIWDDTGLFKIPIFEHSMPTSSTIATKTKKAMLLADFDAVYDEEHEGKQLLCVANYFMNEKFEPPNPADTICQSRKGRADVHFVIGYDDKQLFKDGVEQRGRDRKNNRCNNRPYKNALRRILDGFKLLFDASSGLKYRMPENDPQYTCHIVGKELKTHSFQGFAELEPFLADDLDNCCPFQE